MSSHTAIPYKLSKSSILPSTGNYSGALHNFGQKYYPRRPPLPRNGLSTAKVGSSSTNGPSEFDGDVTVRGEIMGTGVASQKSVARQLAAKQACEALSASNEQPHYDE
ncbi:hypothetical protein Hypma_009122 [Hypsizygus marmoreus]|uniref:DRBM domain-containing protein n=1 Tax=Hypsizygus marmoreus TaxID=39966 RepID=A0A369JSH4_HYPMA|nr:hypothetical protein Hypma_009122 [Hypsizygus marmoreus]